MGVASPLCLLLLRPLDALSLTGSIRSSSSARLVDVATSVIGIDVKDVLVAGAFGDVGAGVEGGGSGGSSFGAVGTGGTTGGTACAAGGSGVGVLQRRCSPATSKLICDEMECSR